MAIRGEYGVSLYALHGEDVELYDSNTKAIWVDRHMPDRRRVIVTSRPIRNDETVYLKLCGTGGVRVGITDLPHYADGDIAEFNGSILFKDQVFEKSVKRTIQKACDGENHVLVYHDEFGAENELMQRKLIPSELVIETLFLFCEIKFGDIRIAFESRDGNSMTYMSKYADQIRFDDNKDAMLTNTTGGIIISDIEFKIDKPMRLILKANQWTGNFIVRYGLTNLSPAETTEETLKLYTIANEQNRNGTLDRNIPTWFKTSEVRTDAFTGSFTFCITKDNEIQTNINSDCETRNMVPFVYTYEKGILVHSGPDLQKPVWLVLEVFECDVRIGLQHEHCEPRGKNGETNTCYTFTHDFGNADAMQYIMEHQSSTIKKDLTKVCSKIKWRKGSEIQFIQSCICDDNETCKQVWTEQSMRVFSSFIERIVIFKRQFDDSVWEQVTDSVDALESIGIKISKDVDNNEIEIIGLQDDRTFTKLLSTIDSIKPPVSMKIDISDVEKLRVLEKFGIVSEIENELHVKIVSTEKGCQVTGSQQNVSNAKDRLLREISMIQEYNCDLSNESFGDILQTPTVQCKIRDQLHVFNLDNNLEWKVKDHKLFVWCRKPELNEDIAQAIFEMITHKVYYIEGDPSENRDVLEANILEVQERIKPYAHISYTIDDSGMEISITCLDGFIHTLIDEINIAVKSCLIKDMTIPIPECIARYINDHLMDELRLNLKQENASDACIKYQNNSFIVRSTLGSHETVLSVVLSLANQVHIEWVAYTARGINSYLSEEEGIDLINSFGKQCDIQVLTQYEMKNSFFHATAVVNSGAAIFAIAGDITDPVEAADIVVNQTDIELKNETGVAKRIALTGGCEMSEDCSTFREKQQCLEPGEVYIGSAGKLPYQKVFHVSIPSDALENKNESLTIADTLKNILRTADAIDDGIFRSIAMPLLGNLRTDPPKQLAKLIIEILKEELEQHNSIRQVFIYEVYPEVCPEIQEEMQRVFKDACFYSPVQKMDINKANTLRPSVLHNLRRNCVRVIPLVGDKKLLIRWGELKSQQADVMVNTTTKASSYGNNGIEDIVQTTAGGIPFSAVYHLRIDPSWNNQSGSRTLQNYVEECLEHAITTDMKSIAFPTIGTAAKFGFPKDEVAKTLLHTIVEFMVEHSSCKLEEIGVVIDDDDLESTVHLESEISQIYSNRPHRLDVIVPEAFVSYREGHKKEKHAIVSTFKVTDSVTFSLTTENIENITADVIVWTTAARNFPNLKFGAISTALKRAGGGDAIQTEISKKYHHGIPKNEIAYTGAGSLPCQKLFYIPLQDYNSSSDVTKITDFVRRCLYQAEQFGHSSICFPAIGTGNFGYRDDELAKAMFDAIQEHFAEPPQSLKEIVIALFAEETNTIQVFQQLASRTFQPVSQPKGFVCLVLYLDKISGERLQDHWSSGLLQTSFIDIDNIFCSREDKLVRSKPIQDFVLLKIVSRDKEKITGVKNEIAERIQTYSTPLYLDFPPHGEDVLQDKEVMRIIKDLATGNHVDIEVDFAKKRIRFNGISTQKSECREKVRRLLSDTIDEHGNLTCQKQLLQNVEWCYLENNGKLLVPYPRSVAVHLEVEESQGADEFKFRDTDGREYVVDLIQMKEYRIENDQRVSAIGVWKHDLSSGEPSPFPDIMDAKEENENVSS